MEENCGSCDNCINPRERYDGTDVVNTVLQAVKQTNERFGLNHLVNVIRGVEDEGQGVQDPSDAPSLHRGEAGRQ